MKRIFPCTVAFALLVGWIAAQEDHPDLSAQSRQTAFARDARLIEAFVEASLKLAEEDHPLRRAQVCNTLADQLGQEIQTAAEKKATERLVALGDMMQSLLVRGVADNLERAKEEAKEESRKEIERIAESSAEMTAPLELSLKKAVDSLRATSEKEAMLPALEALTKARGEVESASTGKGRSKDKGKGKGKKKW